MITNDIVRRDHVRYVLEIMSNSGEVARSACSDHRGTRVCSAAFDMNGREKSRSRTICSEHKRQRHVSNYVLETLSVLIFSLDVAVKR